MELEAHPVRPGSARGRVLLVGLEGAASAPGAEDTVAVVPTTRGGVWRPASPLVRGVILESAPTGGPVAWSIPTVAGLDVGLFRDGDQVEVDGELGRVQLPEVELRAVVTVFLQRGDGRLLLLRRSGKVGTFQGRWAAVSGFLEDPTPLAQAVREVSEETGLDVGGRPPAASAPPLYVRDGREMFVVHAFRFPVGEVEPRLDWEHTAFEWVSPEEIARRPTVPQLDRAWRSVAPR